MNKLINLLQKNEDELISRILEYAKIHNYTQYTSTLKEAWRISISELSAAVISSLKIKPAPPELDPDEDITQDPVTEFGIKEARLHRDRGITISMFLGLFKYYRQTYHDLIDDSAFTTDEKKYADLYLKRVFDRIEIGFTSEWTAIKQEQSLAGLQVTNRNLTNEKNKFMTALESLATPVVLFNDNSVLQYINHEAAKLFNISNLPGGYYYNRDNINLTLPDWFIDPVHSFLNKTILLSSFEHEIQIGRHQHMFMISMHKMMDVSDKFSGAVVVFHDISKRVQAEEYLKQAKKDAEEASRAKSEFIANMSHEIRTPLNAINGFSELMENILTDEEQIKFIQAIRAAGKNLLMLINDILDLSKIEANMLKLQEAHVNMHHIVTEMQDTFSLTAEEKGLTIIAEVDENVPRSIIIDELRIKQILYNLISNAVKFTDKGHVKITVKTGQSTSKNPSMIDLSISVQDTGIGISEEDRADIFKPFMQKRNQQVTKYGGTGLGLSICMKLLNLMGGKISLTSAVGAGSTFYAIIPDIHIGAIDVSTVIPDKNLIQKVNFHNAKVLVVDDVQSNRLLISETLKKSGCTVYEAADGRQAVMLAEQSKPDLILMDILMPEMDGIEATQTIKKNTTIKKTPVIALTASTNEHDLEKIHEYGFNRYIVKPISLNLLLKEMMKLLPYEIRTDNPGQ